MGIWSALTPLGRLALIGAVAAGLGFFILIYNDASDQGTTLRPDILMTLTATSGGQVNNQTPPANTPGVQQSLPSQAAPTEVVSVEEEEPTATAETVEEEPLPTSTEPPPQPTPIPTEPPPTPTPGCFAQVSITVGETDVATGVINCGGVPVSGLTMNAFFNYEGAGTACLGVTDAAGVASCTPGAADFGALESVQACFAREEGQVCASANPP